MAKKDTVHSSEDFKSALLGRLLPKPPKVDDSLTGATVLDLCGIDPKKERAGTIIQVKDGKLHLKFLDYELVTELRFYAITWGIPKK